MLCLLALWGKPHRAAAQFFSAKVNALAALTGTVNVGLDAAVADKWTLDVSGYWNPINSDSFSCRLYAAQIGTKRWLYEAFVGHFISGQLTTEITCTAAHGTTTRAIWPGWGSAMAMPGYSRSGGTSQPKSASESFT